MNNFQKTITILTAVFSLIATCYGWQNENAITELKKIQEKRESISFERDRDFKFKMFDYVVKSLQEDERNRNATTILIENIVEDFKFRNALRNVISTSIKDALIKKEVAKTINSIELEKTAFRFLLDKNLDSARINFKNAFTSFPTLHNVDEINKILKNKTVKSLDWKSLYKEIYPKYQWGMSDEIKNEFIKKTN